MSSTSDPSQFSTSLPHPFTGDQQDCGFPVTLVAELVVASASNVIREIPGWWEKMKDPEIELDWRWDLQRFKTKMITGIDMNYRWIDGQLDYLFKELEWYAEQRLKPVESGRSEVPFEIAIDGTRKADGLISSELKERLLAGVRKLMDVPEHLKDWHPGSNKQVLDLVHPSLFPFIAGRTLVVQDQPAIPPFSFLGQGETMDMAPVNGGIDKSYYSKKFQWLPTDITVSDEGKVRFVSYINNLHPVEHKELYPVLEEILEKFIPMFEDVLADMRVFTTKEKRFKADPFSWHEGQPDIYDAGSWEYLHKRWPKQIEIPEFTPPPEPERYSLRGEKLQVIVKLANIELTPENPKHTGGSWHVEGMANENIVASGIYYYHSENITESRLNFRIHVREPEYEQDDHSGCNLMYGLYNENSLIQSLDGIVTKEDRCLVFPNIFQHQVQPFELVDPTKPGTRKILVFFLVNPEAPILSTTNVPPQQKEWAPKTDLMQQAVQKLPAELVQEIEKLVDWPIETEEAIALRLELMQERKYFINTQNAQMFERKFYLCEH